MQELVSPIALYPDVLIAQNLPASTYPPQVKKANQWLKEHPNLSGDQLAAEVNPQPWGSERQIANAIPTRRDDDRQPCLDFSIGRGLL